MILYTRLPIRENIRSISTYDKKPLYLHPLHGALQYHADATQINLQNRLVHLQNPRYS